MFIQRLLLISWVGFTSIKLLGFSGQSSPGIDCGNLQQCALFGSPQNVEKWFTRLWDPESKALKLPTGDIASILFQRDSIGITILNALAAQKPDFVSSYLELATLLGIPFQSPDFYPLRSPLHSALRKKLIDSDSLVTMLQYNVPITRDRISGNNPITEIVRRIHEYREDLTRKLHRGSVDNFCATIMDNLEDENLHELIIDCAYLNQSEEIYRLLYNKYINDLVFVDE